MRPPKKMKFFDENDRLVETIKDSDTKRLKEKARKFLEFKL